MESIINVQLNLQSKIAKAFINYKKSPTERITKEYVDARLENLERDWDLFCANNTKLYEIAKPEKLTESSYMQNEVYEETEDTYLLYKSSMKTRINTFASQTVKSTTNKSDCDKSSQLVRLPKITIPTFSGLYSEWTEFRNLFVSLVCNNSTLDNIQRLHYLKTHLTGEAAQLVKHTPITDANFSLCWSLLENRYNNKKYLANCILKRLFGQKRLNVESASGLKDILDTTFDCMSALENIEVDVTTWDIIVIHIVTFKLDNETQKQWELHISTLLDSNELPKLGQLKTFLENRFRALEFVDPKKHLVPLTSGHSAKPKTFLATNASAMRCEFCSENHKLCFCKQFAKLECAQRRDFVAKHSICFNCLGSNHSVYQCKKPTTCKICKRRHHTMLHKESNAASVTATKESDESTNQAVSTAPVVSCLSTRKKPGYGQVLLATALVKAESESGSSQVVRALIDQGSQACFITEAVVQLLRLNKSPVRGTITGLGGDNALTSTSVVTLNLRSRNDNFHLQVTAYVLKSITSNLPEQTIEAIKWTELHHLCLADPEFNITNKIDLLLGANVYSQILKSGMKKGPNGTLVAQNTYLGWILSGVVQGCNEHDNPCSISVMHAQVNENDLLKRFWEIEEETFNSKRKILTEEEQKCETIYTTTTKRTTEGRYIVKLPFRDEDPPCKNGDSREIAVSRLKSLERRLSKHPELQDKYNDVLMEYLSLGHMRQINGDDNQSNLAVYLPHHAVIRDDKSTTKVRVVFNASEPNRLGFSLNSALMVGPSLQADLRHTVLRWRTHPIALVADIVKMYRQVLVSEEDANLYQRIVWRQNPEEKIKDYELLTVTFGSSAAPYLAVRTLHQVAYDNKAQYPIAAERILDSFYMDDLMTGCSNVQEGIELFKEISELLERGGFELQKWNSNNENLIKQIKQYTIKDKIQDKQNKTQDNRKEDEGEDQIEDNEKQMEIKLDSTIKILGLTWSRSEDHFRYTMNLPTTTAAPETKRSIISIIAKLYDPLGWLAPTIIIAKMFIQKLWLAGTGWDEQIPAELKNEWDTYHNQLEKLTSVQVPRWIGTSVTDTSRELHGFSDASKLAYSAVVYLRTIDTSGHIRVALLAAKTRVAPIKQVSIPRLELCGAVLLTRLLMEVSEVLNMDKSVIRAWSDSTVVLAWLNSHPSRWQTFVANRVSTILTALDSSQWFHVTSKNNPADCASRGIQPGELADNKLWFSGPDFLRERDVPYKRPKDLQINLEDAVKSHVTAITEDTILHRFSSLQRLLRVIAYCRRFYKRDLRQTTYITRVEINQALTICIKKVQIEEFNIDYLRLDTKDSLESKNRNLKPLCPFLDNNGIMRACGRLQKSLLEEQTKHPIILPHSSHLTKLIVADAHEQTLHGGQQLMLNYLRTAYWVIGAKNLAKQHIRKCVVCVKNAALTQNQFMGSLPTARCSPSRPFLNSGVDYAGPINLRTTKGRGHRAYKGYISLFICMSTRAIHLEVVSDLTSQAFLAAFRRFVARCGHCSHLWSDNGTTFVGASKELNELRSFQPDIASHLEKNGTEWHFIPPRAPNFGGLWEAGVKSTKFHIKRVIGESTLTYEEMSTLLAQIEACLNSRPMTFVNSTDPKEPLSLTPGHFLVGGPLVSVPDQNYEASNINSLSRWQHLQKMLQTFWRRWSQEYLVMLMHRYKWSRQIAEPELDDIVLVKEDNLPPGKWILGRIIEKHPGPDNITRVVTLRTQTSVLKRPTSKLCILPTND